MAKQSLEQLRELLAQQTPEKFLDAQNEAAFNAEQKSGGPSAEAPLLATYVYQLVQMYASRLKDSLAMYSPLRGAEPFHASRAHIRLLRGCIAGDSLIYDPVKMTHRRVDEIEGPFHVEAVDRRGRVVNARASRPFLKGFADLYRVRLSSGRSFVCTAEHRVMLASGDFVPVASVGGRPLKCVYGHLPSIVEPDQQASLADGRRSTQTVPGSLASCSADCRLCGGPLPLVADTCRAPIPSPAGALGRTCSRDRSRGGPGRKSGRSRSCRSAGRPSSRGDANPTAAPSGAFDNRAYGEPYQQLGCCQTPAAGLFARSLVSPLDTTAACLAPASDRTIRWGDPSRQPIAVTDQRETNSRQADRRCIAASSRSLHTNQQPVPCGPYSPPCDCSEDRIESIAHVGWGAYYDLEVPVYHNYVMEGVAHHNSNQAGKTNTATAEFARLLRGMDPYQKRKCDNLRCISVSKDGDHIGQVINRKLFMPGAFDIIRDEQTGLWRAVRPDPLNPSQLDPRDVERKKDWYPAPPYIPPGEIAEWSYDNKKEQVLSLLRLRNGSEVLFKTSASNLMQGVEIDIAWLDEEVENKSWLRELQARCLKREGIIFWSFTPQSGTQQAYDLAQRALLGDDDVQEFVLQLSDNPYIPQASKDKLFRDLSADPEELRVRYYGDWAITGRRVYPTFSEATHCVSNFTPPNNWMRVLALDPGTARPAALLAAVPPEADSLHIFAEVYLRNVDAGTTIKELSQYVLGHSYEAFIIDNHAARQRPMGMQIKVEDAYMQELEKHGLKCGLCGYGFIGGLDDVDVRELLVKRMLMPQEKTGQPQIVIHQNCGNLVRQIKNRYYAKDRPDKREVKGEHDLVDCLEYLAGFFQDGLYYRSPLPAETAKPKSDLELFIEKAERKRKMSQPQGLTNGGSYQYGSDTVYVGLR